MIEPFDQAVALGVVRGCYEMLVCKALYISSANPAVKYFQLSNIRYRTPCCNTILRLKKKTITSLVPACETGLAITHFFRKSTATIIYLFQVLVRGKGPMKSIPTFLNGCWFFTLFNNPAVSWLNVFFLIWQLYMSVHNGKPVGLDKVKKIVSKL